MEEEVWKCPKHPSNRRRSGICPTCLYERLVLLCADCAKVRPCACCAVPVNSGCGTSVDRVSNLIDSEPSFRRSRSVAIPFLQSKFGTVRESAVATAGERRTSSFWSVFRASKSKKSGHERESGELMRSRSVSVEVAWKSNHHRGGGVSSAAAERGRRWHFPSPIKALRQSKISNGVHQRSPLYRG